VKEPSPPNPSIKLVAGISMLIFESGQENFPKPLTPTSEAAKNLDVNRITECAKFTRAFTTSSIDKTGRWHFHANF
jgi:hypothetical protein